MRNDATRNSPPYPAFGELILADRQWLRAEFDAITTANFGEPVPDPPDPAPEPGTGRIPTPPSSPGLGPRRLAVTRTPDVRYKKSAVADSLR